MSAIQSLFKRLPAGKLRSGQKRKLSGQGFVEFALALPILLLLVFGIIEFGRLLQAWLALENGARFAVRYAVTGSYDINYCDEAGAALGLAADDLLDGKTDCVVPEVVGGVASTVKINEDKTSKLQDWARLPSIRDSALSGSTGIAWDGSTNVSGNYMGYLATNVAGTTFDQAERGNPSLPGYFNVSTCSSRITPPDGDYFRINGTDNAAVVYYTPYDAARKEDYRYPVYCEKAKGSDGSTLHYIDDAGGPGDRVRVVLTYRHTMITPFLSSWWPTLKLSTQREGLVEKFRTSRVVGLTGAIALPPTSTFTPAPDTPTFTPRPPTETFTATITKTPTITRTPTKTPLPSCDLLQVSFDEPLSFQNTQYGGNAIETKLQNVGPYLINLYAASLSWNGTWHNEMQAQKSGHTFDKYNFYNPSNTSTYPISHTFPSPYGMSSGADEWFHWYYASPFTFWMNPYLLSYPVPGAKTPTPSKSEDFFWEDQQNFYWPSDFNGTIKYNVIPTGAPTLACEKNLTGWPGPGITPIVPTAKPDGSFTMRAAIKDGAYDVDKNVNWVYFFVYDSNGNRVHQMVNYSSWPHFCLFDVNWNDGSCITRRPLVDKWSSGQVIQNGQYTVVIVARDLDKASGQDRKKSNLIVENLSVFAVTLTPTISPTPTRSPTPTTTPDCIMQGIDVKTTDQTGNTVNANRYDCPNGCNRSPYLAAYNLFPSTYYWWVETTRRVKCGTTWYEAGILVKSDDFTLNNSVAEYKPPAYKVPLGPLDNVPPCYFEQGGDQANNAQFKVFLSTVPRNSNYCPQGPKTDEFSIGAAEPTATPTRTKAPTKTPTNTRVPSLTPVLSETPIPSITPSRTPQPTPTLCQTPPDKGGCP